MGIHYDLPQMIKMGETELTKTLKMAGMLFLKNNLCDLIAPEVSVYPLRALNEQDHHRIIDLCGIGDKYTDYASRRENDPTSFRILRGIEIKISRGDFKNGFIHTGCNYHYLLVPKGLVNKSEVDTKIGIIEYDQENFSVKKVQMKYWFKGFDIIRPPKFQKISERMLKHVEYQIAWCATNQMLQWARKQLDGSYTKKGN